MHDLYQEMILDHSRSPRNLRKIDNASMLLGHNVLCGDKLELYIKTLVFTSDSNLEVIDDISFIGSGCALFTASTSLMTECVKDLSYKDAIKLANDFIDMLKNGTNYNFKKLCVFENVNKYPIRVKCVSLPWQTLLSSLNLCCMGNDFKISTE